MLLVSGAGHRLVHHRIEDLDDLSIGLDRAGGSR